MNQTASSPPISILYEDNNTDDQVTKAIMLVDGKVVDKNSLVTVTKKTT